MWTGQKNLYMGVKRDLIRKVKWNLILFDEFNVPRHEFLAFSNFVESWYVSLQLIGAANNYYFCAFEVC